MDNNQLVDKIDKFTVAHASKFTRGAKSMSTKQFIKLTKSLFPSLSSKDSTLSADVPHFVAAQSKINRILRPKGLKLKSRNYYQEWYIAEDSKAEADHMQKAGLNLIQAASDLRRGAMQNRTSAIMPLASSQRAEIATYINAKAF